jgi:hypothetical protein
VAQIYLVCEGRDGSLDQRVLTRLVINRFCPEVLIVPAGGQESLKSVAGWLVERDQRTGVPPSSRHLPRSYSIRDRNYDSHVDRDASWKVGRHFIWHRHEIENYLLDPRCINHALMTFRDTAHGWIGPTTFTETLVTDLLKAIAETMKDNHVGWCTYKELSLVRFSYDLRFKYPNPTLPPNTGYLYPTRDQWISYLTSESERMRKVVTSISGESRFDLSNIQEIYDRTHARVSSKEYIDAATFLIDYSGHDLIEALLARLRIWLPNLSLDDLQEQLVESLLSVIDDSFFTPNEFKELAERLI